MPTEKCAANVKFEKLADYADKRLLPAEREAFQQHLATGCPACRRELALLERAYSTMSQDRVMVEGVTAPLALLADLRQKFRYRYQQEAAPGLLERLRGALVFDSRMNFAAGTRAVAAFRNPYQLLYNLGNYDLDISVTPQLGTNKLSLTGQLLPREAQKDVRTVFQNAGVSLTGANGLTFSATLDEWGEWEIGSLVPGRYRLEIRLSESVADTALVIEELSFGV
jgi:hypothetical protein